jgi:hypothetical protein
MLGCRISPSAIPPLGVTAFRYTTSARPISKLWNFLFQPLELRAEFFQPLEN